MRSGAVVLMVWLGLFGVACAPESDGPLIVTNRSAETYYLVINTVDGRSAFYRVDPGAHGLAALADADHPRVAVVLYTAICDAVAGSSDDRSDRMVIGEDGGISFDGLAVGGRLVPPLPADARCRW
jgi:hypothetical protein